VPRLTSPYEFQFSHRIETSDPNDVTVFKILRLYNKKTILYSVLSNNINFRFITVSKVTENKRRVWSHSWFHTLVPEHLLEAIVIMA
jgi:hypothetical protein